MYLLCVTLIMSHVPFSILQRLSVSLCAHCDIFHHEMVVYQTAFDANKQQTKRQNMDIHRDTRPKKYGPNATPL